MTLGGGFGEGRRKLWISNLAGENRVILIKYQPITPYTMGEHTHYNFPSERKIQMTEIEGKYLTRREEQKKYMREWFIDVVISIFLAFALLGIVVGIAISIAILTPGAHAEEIKDNATYCQEIAEGKWNLAQEDKKEITSYCSSL